MPNVDRDCVDLLKDVPQYIIDDMKSAPDKKARLAELKAKNARAKELLAMRIEAHTKLQRLIKTHPEGPKAGLVAIITNDTWAKAQNLNVDYYQKGLQGYVEKFIPTLKQELSTGYLGLHVPKAQKELRRSWVRAVIDGVTENPLATKMAKETRELTDFIRDTFNRYGGDVGDITSRTGKGFLPQTHNVDKITKVSKQEWVDFTYSKLHDTTKGAVDRGELDLSYVYDTIITGGLNKVGKEGSSGVKGRGKSVANKHAEKRILDFKDGDAWLDYQERFGANDPLAALDDHIRTMTTDISLVKILGPNPDNMFKTLIDEVMAINTLKGDKKPGEGLDNLEKIYNVVSGKVDQDAGKFKYAGWLQSLRAMNTASLLTNASLSTITDPILSAFTAGYKGMNPIKTVGNYVKNIVRSGAKRTFEEEQLLGLGADVFSSEVTRRYSELGGGFWAKASEAVMRGTMMNILTESARMSFKAQYFKKLLGKRAVEDLTPDEHIALLAKVQEEADYAIIMGDARARAVSTAGEAKGTVTGELRRSTTQFMTFPVSFMIKQGARAFRQQNSIPGVAAYTVILASLLTVGGAMAMMMKDKSKGYGVRKGFNPFSEDNSAEDISKFWRAAAAQGGGLGILGDYAFSDVNRFGNELGVTFGGPTAGLGTDFVKLTVGNLFYTKEGESSNFGSESIEFLNRHVNPVKTWYTQQYWNEYVIRTLKIMFDPEYEKAERRRERKRAKEYGQEKSESLLEGREEFAEDVGAYKAQEFISSTVEDVSDSLQDIIDKI